MLRKIVLAGAFFASSLVMAGSTLPKVSGTTESGQKESLVKSLELSRDGDYCIAKVRIRHINFYWEMCYAYRNDKVYVTLWFDWEGTGKPSSTVKYHVFRKTEEVTMCIPVYIPKKHVSVVSVRAMVDSDQCSVNPAVMPKRGSYLDGSFDAGWGGEAPAFYRVNVGTYAEEGWPTDRGDAINRNNSAMADEVCKVRPFFKMTQETAEYWNEHGGFWVKCDKDSGRVLTEFNLKPVKDFSDGYKLYGMKKEFSFTPSLSTDSKSYGKKTIKITYGNAGQNKSETWHYYVFFPLKSMSGDKPLWFRLWKQILPKMEEFHYTSARDVASDLNYKVLDNTKELEAAAESVGASGGTIDVPIRFSKTKYLGAAVHDIYFSSDFSVKDVSYSGGSPMSVAYRGCQIESEKDRLLSLLTATVKVDGRGGASLAGTNDTDNDCVINSIEDFYGLKKGSDTFGVLKKYRKLRGTGDLEYAARRGCSLNLPQKYREQDWSCPGSQSGSLEWGMAAANSKSMKATLMAAGDAWDCTSDTVEGEEALVRYAELKGQRVDDAGVEVERVRETTRDFENKGLEFTVEATAREAGECDFHSYLTGVGGVALARANTTGALAVGRNSVPLRFSAETMALVMAEDRGPWTVTTVAVDRMTEEGGKVGFFTNLVPCISGDYSGRACVSSVFHLAGKCQDRLQNRSVVVSVPLGMPCEGDRVLHVGLATKEDGLPFAISTVSNYFGKGVTTVDFTFTPKMMSAAKTDGPYFVVELAVDPMGIEGGTALAIRHKTQAYAFADVTDGRPVVAIDVSKAGLSPYWLGSKDNRREHNCIGFDFWVPVVNRDREVSHNVLLEAVFADAKGMELAVASDQVNVGAAAEKNASLRFPINEIVDSGSLGPFTVIRASLRDAESGEILDSCGAVDVWTDEYAEGELKAIEPPFVDEEMAYVDVLASSNGSRLSGICLTVPVVTKYDDTVIGTAELYGGDGTRLGLGMVSATPDEAEEGLQIVFDGDVISNSGNDGPYEIRNLTVYVSEAPEARHVSERVYETAAFRHEDFVSPSFDYATFPNGIGTFSAKKKHAYDGIVVAPGGTCVGTIRITTAVAKKSGVSAATAKITLFGQKAVAFSGKASKGGKATLSAKGVPTACTLSLGSLGFEGHWGPYAIFGSRDDYSTKGSAAARELAKGVKGAWTLLARSTCLLLVVDAKGGVKITGRDGGGHSVASTSRVIRGDGFVYIPVNIAETKKTDACHALIRIDGVLGEVSVLDGEGLQMDSEPSCSKTEKPRFDSVPSRFDAMVGGSFSADFEVNDFCYPYLFSAKNLPKGLAIDKKTGRIAGVPSAAGTKNVRVTATSLYNKKWKSSVDFKIVVAPIPDEFVGAFSGVISDPTISDGNLHDNGVGTFSVTVAKTGKISGKVYYEGKTSTFSAASFDSPRLVGGEWRTSISADIFCAGVRGWFNWIFKQRDGFVENVDGARLREYGGHSDWACSLPDLDTMEYSLYRNVWKDKNATRALNDWSGEYVAVTRGGDGLSLVLDGAGVVKFAGTLADGRVVSASTPLIALNGDRFVWLVLPADGSKGWERVSECFHLQNVPGTPEPGKVACRKPGVRLSKTYGGSVTMSPAYGQVEIGQSVKLTAKASKGYVFLGWFEEESVEPVSQKTTYYSVHAGADRKLTARFMKESEVRKLRPDFFWNATTRFPVGIVYEAQPSAHGVSLVKVKSVTKLPKGLVWKKGKVSGVPTVAKKSTAMVTVALSSNAKIQWTYKIPLTVSPLPGWTVGTFSGDAGKVTVSSVGKISAKIKQGGTNWTFTANSYVAMEVMEGVTNLLAEGRMKHTYEDGKKKKHTIAKSVEFVVQPPSTEGLWDSSITGLTDMGEFTVWRSIWGDEPTKRYLTLNGCVGVYSYPVLVDGEELGVLSLKVSDTGKLTIAGRLRPPTDQLTGIPEGVVENLDRKISVTTTLRYDVTKGVYVEYAIPSTAVTAKVSAKRGKSTITTKYTVTFPAVVIWKEIQRESLWIVRNIPSF